MKMKRLLFYFGLLLTCLLVLNGCGGSKNDSADGKGKTQLVFSYWAGSSDKINIEKMISNFNESHDDIFVKGLYVADNYAEKINALASTNDLPDVGYMVEANMAEWTNSNKLYDLSYLYQAGEPLEGKIPESVFQYEQDGAIGGSSASTATATLFYNKKYFEENNIEPLPQNSAEAYDWDQFIALLNKLTIDRNGKHPDEKGFKKDDIETYGIGNFTSLFAEMFMQSNGGGIVSEDGKQILIGQKESIQAIQNIADLMYKYNVMPKPSQASTVPSADTALLTNRIAISLDGSWSLDLLGNAKENSDLELGIGTVPKMGNKVVSSNWGTPIVMFKNENTKKNKKAAEEFLTYVMDPQYSKPLIDSGVWQPNEVSWYTEEDNVKKWAENEKYPEGTAEVLEDNVTNNLERSMIFHCADATKINNIVNPALDQVWTGKKSAEEVIKGEILPKLKKELGEDSYEYVE